MNKTSTYSDGKGNGSDSSKVPPERERPKDRGCCDIDIHIDSRGDVNIYNCSPPGGAGATPPTPPQPQPCGPCFPPVGACFPAVPGAKHKLSRNFKLTKLAARARVPSALAAGTMHMARRFLLGKSAANPLEATAFALFGRITRDTVACTVAAFDAVPADQRGRLFASSLLLDPDQPLDGALLTAALAEEIKQRIGVQVFDDPLAPEQEQAGRIRVFVPGVEDFFSQVRICSINGLRTANVSPSIDIGAYLPSEIQQDCAPQIVDGQPQVICQVRTTDCPGNSFSGVCMVVQDVAQGDSVVLSGVNYFSVDAKVRITDKLTQTFVRDVDTFVRGDQDTQVNEVVNGETKLINDCRVHDQLTFQVPIDLAPAIYQIQVVVPNITGIPAFGTALESNREFINVLPPATARFQIVTEKILARRETSPQSLGSDEVGLHTLAYPLFADGTFGTDDQQRTEQRFKDIQSVDFDSGTHRDITRIVFKHDQPILGMVMAVFGDEIDSQRAYDSEITSRLDFFGDLLKEQAKFIGASITALGGLAAILKLGPIGAIIIAIALVITIGIDIIIALWAPADPIIRDAFGLTVVDLAALTSANSPIPPSRSFETQFGIVVNVNGSIPPVKGPLEYHETREYVSDDQDSRYELTYQFNRIA
jgi:hypothetical protein